MYTPLSLHFLTSWWRMPGIKHPEFKHICLDAHLDLEIVKLNWIIDKDLLEGLSQC
jgi:hypothetical protein